LGSFLKTIEGARILRQLFHPKNLYIKFDENTGWATFLAIFSQTNLVALLVNECDRTDLDWRPHSVNNDLQKNGCDASMIFWQTAKKRAQDGEKTDWQLPFEMNLEAFDPIL
jgi:hypothetical protein